MGTDSAPSLVLLCLSSSDEWAAAPPIGVDYPPLAGLPQSLVQVTVVIHSSVTPHCA